MALRRAKREPRSVQEVAEAVLKRNDVFISDVLKKRGVSQEDQSQYDFTDEQFGLYLFVLANSLSFQVGARYFGAHELKDVIEGVRGAVSFYNNQEMRLESASSNGYEFGDLSRESNDQILKSMRNVVANKLRDSGSKMLSQLTPHHRELIHVYAALQLPKKSEPKRSE